MGARTFQNSYLFLVEEIISLGTWISLSTSLLVYQSNNY